MKKLDHKLKVESPEVKNTVLNANDFQIKDFKMISHRALSNLHSSLSKGIIICNKLPLFKRVFIKESHTKKREFNFGKSESWYYLNEPANKMFETFDELIEDIIKNIL
jgi:hypothetical protein